MYYLGLLAPYVAVGIDAWIMYKIELFNAATFSGILGMLTF